MAAPRIHDQWFPEVLSVEPDIAARRAPTGSSKRGHKIEADAARSGAVNVLVRTDDGHRGRRRAAQPEHACGILIADARAKITKVLIANRGEIACRVIRACRELGPAHGRRLLRGRPRRAARAHGRRGGRHRAAARARELPASIDKIIDASRRRGADAVHPGYGFLSENADFAEACAAAGATFIGPPPSAIRAMGGKTSARALMQAAGVPVVPGDNGEGGRGLPERGRRPRRPRRASATR